MRTLFPIILCVAAGSALLGCSTTKSSQEQWREQFLLSHGFRRDERDGFRRHYDSLREASRHIGFSTRSAVVLPNGPVFGGDVRVFDLHGWGFVVAADEGRTLDDLSTPCTVGTALLQGPREKERPKGFR